MQTGALLSLLPPDIKSVTDYYNQPSATRQIRRSEPSSIT
jgi:hypothetical protein